MLDQNLFDNYIETQTFGVEDASTTNDKVDVIAQLQQARADKELVKLGTLNPELAALINDVESGVAQGVGRVIGYQVTTVESAAATLARNTHGIVSLVFNANGGKRGKPGNAKGSRAAARAATAERAAARAAFMERLAA